MFRPLLCLVSVLTLLSAPAQSQAPRRALEHAPSAWLQSLASSPVQWLPWTDATLDHAKAGQRPVYVLVASELSEFSRATLRETFSRASTAEWMNTHFVCVIVDADAQPEIAAYAQQFIQSVRQLRGLPVHLWLTPDFQPYEGANYLPPSEEWGKPGFLKTARNALDTWAQNPERARTLATEAQAMLQSPPLPSASAKLTQLLERAAAGWIAAADPIHGGFGDAPKLPEPEVIQFLVRGSSEARDAGRHAAHALVTGATHDAMHGGFFRRTLDAEWKEPYRQKTLLDQARIARALLEAHRLGPDPVLRDAACGALDFAWRELRLPSGALAAALDGTDLPDTAAPASWTKSGSATLAAHAWLLAALVEAGRSSPARSRAAISELRTLLLAQVRAPDGWLSHQPHSAIEGTATDYLAVAHALRVSETGDSNALADQLVQRACSRFFDATRGTFLASPPKLPAGIGARVPLGGEGLTAERVSLLVGLNPSDAAAVRNALASQIEYDPLPPGEVLLALVAAP